ncbi:MAG: hypothetical protein K6U09_01215 [Acidobacteriia bacterium]|jgi:hypothetical protein|nr:hypothetical protein [Terriglobia bacterium]
MLSVSVRLFPLSAVLLWQMSCAVPLGPGYQIRRQEVTLHYAPARPSSVHVQAQYELENTGNAPLATLAFSLPAAAAAPAGHLVVAVEERVARPQPEALLSAEPGYRTALAIAFSPPWPQRERIRLRLDYDLPLPAEAFPAETPRAFLLEFADWFAELIPPDRVFARGTERGETVHLRIRVPTGWRALSSGKPKGSRSHGEAIEHRYELTLDDFDPFVLIGSYHEQRFRIHGQRIVFWTLSRREAAELATSAEEVAGILEYLEQALGPREKRAAPVWVAELPGTPVPPRRAMPRPDSFARGILLVPAREGSAVAAEKHGGAIAHTLATLWLHWLATPTNELGDGWAAYLSCLVREHRQSAVPDCSPEALLRAHQTQTAAGATREAATIKAHLLARALEERLGRPAVLAALRQMLQARRGQTWNANDLRAALEAEARQDLGEFFRTWLGQHGLPETLRQPAVQGNPSAVPGP